MKKNYRRYAFGEAIDPMKINATLYGKLKENEICEAFFKLQKRVKELQSLETRTNQDD